MPPHVGGIERVAEQQATAYRDAGHAVTWLATAAPLPAGTTQEDGVVRIRVAAANGLEARFALPFPIIGPAGLRSVASAVRGADLVHLHDCLYPPTVVADQAARRHGVPTIVTQHVGVVPFGPVLDALLPLAYRTVGRRVLCRASGVAFVSEQVRDWFAAHVDRRIGGIVIPNAVDTERFAPGDPERRAAARAALGLAPDGAVVAFVGRLVPKKGLPLLVSALERLPEARLIVVGDGPERELIGALGPRVTFHPQLPRHRMPEVYQAADVFGLVSRGEGLPVALLEALASGLPAVVSDDPGFESLAGCAGVTRVRPEAGNVARAIRSLLADPGARAVQGAAARAWALERHTPAAFGSRYLALAEAALSGTAAPPRR